MKEKIKKIVDWLSNQPIENWELVDSDFGKDEFLIRDNRFIYLIKANRLNIRKNYNYDYDEWLADSVGSCLLDEKFIEPCIEDLYEKIYNKHGEYLLDDILTKIE